MDSIAIRVVGTDLPGLTCGGYEHVHVGVQRGRDPEQLVPADPAARAVFSVAVSFTDGDFKGPYAQGKRGARFIYLTWGELPPGGEFKMFRRAKLMFADVDDALVRRAATGEGVLEARLALTDRAGMPLCATVRPPVVSWRIVQR
jgi:hypothetical protein